MTSSIKRQVQWNSHERAHHAWADGKSFEITDVVANSPATGAGLKVGNRILTIDGQKSDQLD